MVLLPDGRAKIMAKGRAEGEARRHSAWADWYARWEEAKAKGESFDEPPPAPPDGYRKGESDDGGNE